jgi:hypothetical protein
MQGWLELETAGLCGTTRNSSRPSNTRIIWVPVDRSSSRASPSSMAVVVVVVVAAAASPSSFAVSTCMASVGARGGVRGGATLLAFSASAHTERTAGLATET